MSLINFIKGITITPPTIGRIMMGKVTKRGDKYLPQKEDHFSVTSLVQQEGRTWEPHEVAKKLGGAEAKLKSIPVRLVYNDPNLSISNSYSCFNEKGRVMCVGNGINARRQTPDGVVDLDCPRPEACEYGQRARCANRSRFYFHIDGQDDELGTFVLRTTSWNTLGAIVSRVAQLHGLTGGRIAGIPLSLKLVAKSTMASMRTPIYYADLAIRDGMNLFSAVKDGFDWQARWSEAGLSLDGLEAALKSGMTQSEFTDCIEDVDEWISDDDFLAEAMSSRQMPGGLRSLDEMAQKIGLNLAAAENPGAPEAAAESQEPAHA